MGEIQDGVPVLTRFRFYRDSVVVLTTPRGDSLALSYVAFYDIARAFEAFDMPGNANFETGFEYEEGSLRLFLASSPLLVVMLLLLLPLLLLVLWLLARSRRVRARALDEQQRVARLRRLSEQSREDERRRLARELHDGPLQELYALRMSLARAQPPDDEQDALVVHIADDLRTLTEELRSPLLSDYGLVEALRTLFERHQTRTHLSIVFDPEAMLVSQPAMIPEPQATALFRVAQEALSNVARHSRAQHVRVRLRTERQRDAPGFALEVEDDGQGFSVPRHFEDLGSAGHFGLLGKRERMEVLGGGLNVQSVRGQGTRVVAWVPEIIPGEVSQRATLPVFS